MKYIVIIVLLMSCTICQANNEQEALKKCGLAVVKEFGIDKKLKQLGDRYIPDFIKEHGGIVLATHKAITTKYIEFKWEF